jgi:hypothetical protein
MNEKRLTDSICTLSWINGKTGLPENDKDGPPNTLPGRDVTRQDDALPFRFLNLLEVTVLVNGSPPRVVSGNFTQDSKIYRNPSYKNIPSEPFETKQSKTQYPDKVIFQQIAGARTVSPEVIAEAAGATAGGGLLTPFLGPVVGPIVGDRIGRKMGHALGFPPIWTILQLTVYADGRSEGAVLCNSLFPSMNYYAHVGGTAGLPRMTSSYQLVGTSYDAVPHLDDWKANGWGALRGTQTGPCAGNPWGLKKEDLTIREVDSNTRIV